MAKETVFTEGECQMVLQMIENSQFTINGTSIEPLYVLIQKLKGGLPIQKAKVPAPAPVAAPGEPKPTPDPDSYQESQE